MEINKEKFNELTKINNVLGGIKDKLRNNNIDEWEKSITIDNCQVVDYENLIKITNFLPDEIKNSLSKPLELVELKFERRKAYYEYMKTIKNMKERSGITKGYGNIKKAFAKKKYIEIKVDKFPFNKECLGFGWILGKKKKLEINVTVNSQITGYELIFDKGSEGQYVIENFPIIGNKIKCSLEGKSGYPVKGDFLVYHIVEPE